MRIAILNKSTVVSAAETQEIAAAVNIQLQTHLKDTWDIKADCRYHTSPPANKAWLAIFDDSDQAGALGYHDLTPDLLPVAKVFAKTCIHYEQSISVCVSHEALELAGDPQINLSALNSQDSRFYARELCDAVESDDYGYNVNGVIVSDFVLPAFFVPRDQTEYPLPKFDYRGHLTTPFQTGPKGYQSYIDLNDATAGWQQEFGMHYEDIETTASRHDQRRRAADRSLYMSYPSK